MPTLTDEQRAAIAKQDAEDWRRFGCCWLPLLGALLAMILLVGLFIKSVAEGFNIDFRSPDGVVKEVASPDGKYVVVELYGRSTGPEGGHELVALRERSEALRRNSEGEVESSQIVFDGWDTGNVEVSWQGSRKLVITANCHDGRKPPSMLTLEGRDITITFPDCPSRYGSP